VNITKLDLAIRVSKKLDKTATEMKLVIESLVDEILTVLTEGHRIELRGFGVFKTKTRRSRKARNPRTGEEVQIPSYVAPTFKFSKDGQKVFDTKLIERAATSVPAYSSKSKSKAKKKKAPPVEQEHVPTPAPSSTALSAETFSPV